MVQCDKHALIFDLDGTFIDTVYAHVIACQSSFAAEEMTIEAWSLHAKIGLSGEQLAITVARELGKTISADQAECLDKRHNVIMKELLPHAQPLPGGCDQARNEERAPATGYQDRQDRVGITAATGTTAPGGSTAGRNETRA
jgi:beta-phosphoglucomutase-like phosphatase (HAD superfamily)